MAGWRVWLDFGLGSRQRRGTHRFGDMVVTDIVV